MPLFIKRPTSVQVFEAIQLPAGAQATVSRGRPPRPGDYFVTDHSSGETFAMTPDEFTAMYEPLSVPSSVLAAEHQAQQEQRTMTSVYQPEVMPDYGRAPGYTGYPQPQPPADNPSINQPMTESLPGRPSPTPEVRPRLGVEGEQAPVTTPTGIPAQPSDADKAHTEPAPVPTEQTPTGQPQPNEPGFVGPEV